MNPDSIFIEPPDVPTVRSTVIDIAKLAAAGAALSIVVVFLVSIASVMYTRGLFSVMGFPASAIGVKSAADMFSVIGYQRCVLVVAVGITGFIPAPWSEISERVHDRVVFSILIISLLMMAVSVETESQEPIFRVPMGVLAFVLPVFIGYVFRSTQNSDTQIPKVLLICVTMLAAFSINLRLIGSGHGIKVMAAGLESTKASLESHLARTAEDFSIVTLVSKEELSFLTPSQASKNGYEYAPCPGEFLRLIAEDESKYFLIARKNQKITPFIVRKEIVIAISFKADSAVSRPMP